MRAVTPGQRIELQLDTAERISSRLTAPQRLAIERGIANKGLCTLMDGRRGLRRAGWTRMMNRLVELGAATEYLDGDYYVTPAGELAIAVLNGAAR